jgi:gluconokinase
MRAPLEVVVMGVSGTGKSTLGTALATRLGVPYADGDSFHSSANVAKMAAGVPLTDDDRWPWLLTIGGWLHAHRASGAVVSCSALRRAYRDALTHAAPQTTFLHLRGDPALIRQRMAERATHFMPLSLLDSQLAQLEPLGPDERGMSLDIGAAPAAIIDAFLEHFGAPA